VSKFPPHIPIHFGITGKADMFVDNKAASIIIPTICTGILGATIYFSRNPQKMIYLWPITRQNSLIQYNLKAKFTRFLGFSVCGILCAIQYYTLDIATKRRDGIPKNLFLSWLASLCIGTASYYYFALSNK